jgi:hypothetical protein
MGGASPLGGWAVAGGASPFRGVETLTRYSSQRSGFGVPSSAAGPRPPEHGCFGCALAVTVVDRLGGLPAARAEARIGRKRVTAPGAADDGLLSDRTPAVRTEMRAPDDRRAAIAAACRRAPAGCGGGEHRVELVEAGLEAGDVARMLAQQVLAELLPPVHLHGQPAEIP